jgi:hypothetical protein
MEEANEGEISRNTEAIVGHVVLTEDDVRRALANAPEARHGFIRIAATVTLLGVVVPVTSKDSGTTIRSLAACAILVPAMLFGRAYFRRRAAKEIFAGKGERQRTVSYEFAPSGVRMDGPGSEGRSEWSVYHRCYETPDAFLLYVNPAVYHVVPKRAFRETDVPRLRQLFDAHLVNPPLKSSRMALVILWVVLILIFVAAYYLLIATQKSRIG